MRPRLPPLPCVCKAEVLPSAAEASDVLGSPRPRASDSILANRNSAVFLGKNCNSCYIMGAVALAKPGVAG
jgi:hypothetical protein